MFNTLLGPLTLASFSGSRLNPVSAVERCFVFISGQLRFGICCSNQVFPSGSLNLAYSTPPRPATSPTSTPFSSSSLRAVLISSTTKCNPLSVPGCITTPGFSQTNNIEHSDPGGVILPQSTCRPFWTASSGASWLSCRSRFQ